MPIESIISRKKLDEQRGIENPGPTAEEGTAHALEEAMSTTG